MNSTIRTAVTLAATLAASLGVPGPAIAGSYIVTACSPTSSPGLWAQTNTFPAALATGNLCGGPAIGPTDETNQGALFAEDVLNSPANIPDGARAGWTLTAPEGTTIAAISYYRTLTAYNNSNMSSGLFQANGSPLEQCKIPWPFVSGSSIHCDKLNDQGSVTFTGLSTSSLFLGVACRLVDNALACLAGGAPLHAARAALYSARVTLSESGAPTLGSLCRRAVGRRHRLRGRARHVHGHRPERHPGAAGPQRHRPDADLRPAGLRLHDYAAVPAAARRHPERRHDPRPRRNAHLQPRRDRRGREQPDRDVAARHGRQLRAAAADPRRGSEGGRLQRHRAHVDKPARPAPPIARAMVQLCQATCPPATAISASGAAQLTAPGPGLYSVRLWLLDTQGRGGEHNAALATVGVPAADGTVPGIATPARTQITAVITGRRLRVSGTVMRSGRVRVSWRSKRATRTLGAG